MVIFALKIWTCINLWFPWKGCLLQTLIITQFSFSRMFRLFFQQRKLWNPSLEKSTHQSEDTKKRLTGFFSFFVIRVRRHFKIVPKKKKKKRKFQSKFGSMMLIEQQAAKVCYHLRYWEFLCSYFLGGPSQSFNWIEFSDTYFVWKKVKNERRQVFQWGKNDFSTSNISSHLGNRHSSRRWGNHLSKEYCVRRLIESLWTNTKMIKIT